MLGILFGFEPLTRYSKNSFKVHTGIEKLLRTSCGSFKWIIKLGIKKNILVSSRKLQDMTWELEIMRKYQIMKYLDVWMSQ